MSDIKTCKCCGKTYKFCNHCEDGRKTPWKNFCDTEECRDLFNIVSAYNMGLVDASRVQDVIQELNITDYHKYVPSVAKVLEEVTPKKKNKKNRDVDIELIQDDSMEEIPIDEDEIEGISF